MTRPDRRVGLAGLRRAFDEARFGTARTLNLRESLPTPAAATIRLEAWLRQQQVERTEEVLVITGRGNRSENGVSVVREAVLRMLHLLKRRGVITGHQEHTPGSFIVRLAPVTALLDAPKRRRDHEPPPPRDPPSLDALAPDARTMLRNLAERALEGLGIQDTAGFVDGEMLRQFSILATTVGTGPDRERRLRAALRAALDQYE